MKGLKAFSAEDIHSEYSGSAVLETRLSANAITLPQAWALLNKSGN